MRNYANKYRPNDFSTVVGQDNIVKILQQQIKEGNIKNGYLFTGPAGTGKTTTARILSKRINDNKGGIVEIDAASNNGVENIRNLIENAKFKSIDTKYKIYIIDEVHMLSIGAFNALLKILEEPPSHVVFIACTTDPQKIPATIMSRLQRFDFKRVSLLKLCNHLKNIAQLEKLKVSDEAIKYMAYYSGGGVRDAVSNLDLCASYSNNIDVALVLKVMGKKSTSHYIRFISDIVSNKQRALDCIDELYADGVNLKQYMKDVCNVLVQKQVLELGGEVDMLTIEDVSQMPEGDYTGMISSLLQLLNFIKFESEYKYIIQGWVITHDWAK